MLKEAYRFTPQNCVSKPIWALCTSSQNQYIITTQCTFLWNVKKMYEQVNGKYQR